MILITVSNGTDQLSMWTDIEGGLPIETLKSAFSDGTNLINPAYESKKVLLRYV